jgi:hypothetical protein
MGQFRHTETMFRSVTYNQFTSAELKVAMGVKRKAILAKIEERKGRINALKAAHGITSEIMEELLTQYARDQERGQMKMAYTYSNSVGAAPGAGGSKTAQDEVIIPAGVITNITTEKGLIASENDELKHLDLILRNLKDEVYYNHPDTGVTSKRMAVHTLTDDEMEYLGY